MQNSGKKLDLLKIGVFLIGISGLIISSIMYDMYGASKDSRAMWNTEFSAFCSEKAIIISANEELFNIEVTDNQSNGICAFDTIRVNSEELCIVDSDGMYIVKGERKKDIVECSGTEILRPMVAMD